VVAAHGARNAAPTVECRTALRSAGPASDGNLPAASQRWIKAIAARPAGLRGQLELERRAMGNAVRDCGRQYQELLGVLRRT